MLTTPTANSKTDQTCSTFKHEAKLVVRTKKPFRCVEPFHFLITFSISIQFFCYQSILISSACKFNFNESACTASVLNHSASELSKEVEEQAQITAVLWNMIGNIGFGVLSTLASRIIGKLTDRGLNKRTALWISTLGATVASMLLIACDRIKVQKGSYFTPAILISYLLFSGVFASSFVVLSTANAYLAAVIPANANKTLRFTYLQTMYFLAQIFAPWTAGSLINHFSRSAALCLAMVCSLLGFIYVVGFLQKAPVSQLRRESASAEVTNRKKPILFLHPNSGVKVLLISCCLITIAYGGASSFYYLYIRRRPFSFSEMQAGRFLSSFQLVQSVGLIVLMPIFTKKLGVKDINLVFIGLTSKSVFFLLLAIARNEFMLYTALWPTIFLCIDNPSIRSILMSLSSPEEQGEVFGMQSSFQSLGYLISQLVLQPMYRISVKTTLPGSVFLISSTIIAVTTAAIIIYSRKGVFQTEQPNEIPDKNENDSLVQDGGVK